MSGFYGDRLSAAREMVEGGPIDFLTGDYLAELTMAILYKTKLKRPDGGYAHTFLKQMEEVMGLCLDKNIRVVVNAGGLNPAGLAKALTELASTLQLQPTIAYIEGDDLMPRLQELQRNGVAFRHIDNGLNLKDSGMLPVSANAYLGCWGIVEALNQRADIVVTGRVADTSLVMGPAAHHFRWEKDNWDALAGAAAAGHIIECSGQATGGNYSNFAEVATFKNLGFPIAEVFADGSSIITKHPETGGLVNVGTVTSQLFYEVSAPEYITPDVVAHFDTLEVKEVEEDRVSLSGTKGSPATNTSKVTVNCHAGFQNSMKLYIAGLDIEQKVAILKQGILDSFGGEGVFGHLEFQYFPTHKDNPSSHEEALAQLHVSVFDQDIQKAGKFFNARVIELALSTVPGIFWGDALGPAKPRIVHFPTLINKKYLQQQVFIGGTQVTVDEMVPKSEGLQLVKEFPQLDFSFENEEMVSIHLGRLYAARSGDKGGNANLGVWGTTAETYAYLKSYLTVDKLKELLPDTAGFEIQRFDFPNLLGLNFYLLGFLGDGVAANTRLDKQAKSLGDYLRAKLIKVPKRLSMSTKS